MIAKPSPERAENDSVRGEPEPLARYTRTAESAANEVIRAYSTSFGSATRLLGRRHRQHIRNIYALVRVADEIVDGVAEAAGVAPREQAEALQRLVEETNQATRSGFSSNLVVHAFAATARASRIDQSLTEPFFASMRTDLEGAKDAHRGIRRFDRDAHDEYVYGSAEVVGLMCVRVFLRDESLSAADHARVEHGARQLGAAFQNVNFLRDLADDTHRLGRSYLVDAERLTDADRDEWTATIRQQLADARATLPLLPRDARTGVRCALDVFAALNERLAKTPTERLYRQRVRVPNALKALIISRAVALDRLRS